MSVYISVVADHFKVMSDICDNFFSLKKLHILEKGSSIICDLSKAIFLGSEPVIFALLLACTS